MESTMANNRNSSEAAMTRLLELHFDPGVSTDCGGGGSGGSGGSPNAATTPRSPLPQPSDDGGAIGEEKGRPSRNSFNRPWRRVAVRRKSSTTISRRLRTSPDAPPQPSQQIASDDDEPEIDIASFMPSDPNFYRETPDSQSMEKALGTLMSYLSSYPRMKQFKPVMLVFLHSLLARKEAKWYKALNCVLFDWIVDDWRRCCFPPKQAKRTAYAIYSTFLHREGPLSLLNSVPTIDPELGLPRPADLTDTVRGLSDLFVRQPTDQQLDRVGARLRELQERLLPMFEALVQSVRQEVITKRRDGFVSDILPAIDSLREDLSEDKQQLFFTKSRSIMLAHLQFLASALFGGELEAGCLATVLSHVFQLKPDANSTDWPVGVAAALNCPRDGGGGVGGRKLSDLFMGEKRGSHQLRLVELDQLKACTVCGRVLCGPGPQGYACTVGDCEVMSHKACLDRVKPIGCSTKFVLMARNLGGSRDSISSCSTQKPPPPPTPPQQQQQQLVPGPNGDGSSLQSLDAVTDIAGNGDSASVGLGRHSRSPSLPAGQLTAPDTGSVGQQPLNDSSSLSAPDTEPKDEDPVPSSAAPSQPSPAPSAPQQPPPPQQQGDSVSGHPDIKSVPVDFHGYIVEMDLNNRLTELRKTYERDFDRLKEYQLALHEIVFSSMSHLRALTMLDLLFVQDWPPACRDMLNQLGLHFVPECIALYKSLLGCLRGQNLDDFQRAGLLEKFGERLLAWYGEGENVFEFQRLSLSFGFAKTATKRRTANINEDDIILRLISLRQSNQDFGRFFNHAESHSAMNKRRFVDLYSVNMQQTMRMVTLLDTAVKKAKKAKSACGFASKDAEKLEFCLVFAKNISDYSNTIGVKLKELSRQLVLSKSYANFWEKSMMTESQVHKFRNQISHLHTCRLHLTREVYMPGLENYRLRLFVFAEFLLVISESEEGRTIKYQLLKHLGPSMSVDSQQQQMQQQQPQQQTPQQQQQQQSQQQSQQQQSQQPDSQPQQQPQPQQESNLANLIAVSCPPIIPMESVLHVFDTDTAENRRRPDTVGGGSTRARCAEFRIIVEQTVDNSGRVKPMMLEFRVGQERPRLPFLANEASSTAGEFAECIRKLAPRLSSRLDRHSSIAGSSTDLIGGGSGARGSALVAAATATTTAAVASAAAERHRRANSHASGLGGTRSLVQQQQQLLRLAAADPGRGAEDSGSEADAPAAQLPHAEDADESVSSSSTQQPAGGAEEAPAATGAAARQLAQDICRRQQELMAIQQRNLIALMRLKPEDCASIAERRQQPRTRSEKILVVWRLLEDTHKALADILPCLGEPDENQPAVAAEATGQELTDSILAGVAAAARAAADSIVKETPEAIASAVSEPSPYSSLSQDIVDGGGGGGSSSSLAANPSGEASPCANDLSPLSGAAYDSLDGPAGAMAAGQTPPPGDLVVVERRAQITLAPPSGSRSGGGTGTEASTSSTETDSSRSEDASSDDYEDEDDEQDDDDEAEHRPRVEANAANGIC